MVDPDATAATRIAPRRPGSAPMWADRSLESITSGATTTGTQDEEKTPVAALRTRLAASKYVATGSLSLPSTSPKTSPRMSSSRILASVVDMDELPVPSSLPSSPLTRRISPPHLAAVTEEEEETTSVRAKSPVPALYAKSLQDEVTSYRELLQKLKGDVVQRDTIIAKLMPVQDEMRELRAALLESRNTNKELKIEQSELREQLSDMEGVNAELRDGIQVAADEKHELNQKLEETQYDLQVARDDMNASGIQSSVSAREGPMELRAKLEEAEYQLQAAIDEKDIAVHELSHAESNMVLDLEDHNEMLSSKVTTLNASIEEKNTELEMMRAELETTSVELEAKDRSEGIGRGGRREATPKVLGEADSNRSPFYGNGNGAEKNHHAHSDQLKIKDMKIKALERQVKRLNEDRELLSVAANSAQIQPSSSNGASVITRQRHTIAAHPSTLWAPLSPRCHPSR
ncbi:uncharacterized protein EHS24_005514 [Apiotrichum porosum]|uniref:Uncharacterized protein n=1 Tax=Apiotrichum porosum TaxID=105984 RepID=A0A427XCP0_9TREE|nr:uncharacterized protein EHS24_005514 [Apiotrichum porosum]RSH76629.1 hypothetical protein EHS24_005514 [Apiotrichum porosum]